MLTWNLTLQRSPPPKRRRETHEFVLGIDIKDGMTYADIKTILTSIDPTRSYSGAVPTLGDGIAYPELGVSAWWMIKRKTRQQKATYEDVEFNRDKRGFST
jgi:hypothetical protein